MIREVKHKYKVGEVYWRPMLCIWPRKVRATDKFGYSMGPEYYVWLEYIEVKREYEGGTLLKWSQRRGYRLSERQITKLGLKW